MKIDNKLTTPLSGDVPTDSSRLVKPGGAAGRDAAPGASVDVQLSDLASQLQALQARLLSGDSVDAAKVAEIRQAIADGRFQVNADAIADRLLETVRELLEGSQQR